MASLLAVADVGSQARLGGVLEIALEPAEHALPALRVAAAGVRLPQEAFVTDGHPRTARDRVDRVRQLRLGSRAIPVVVPGLDDAPGCLDLQELSVHGVRLSVNGLA